MSKNNVDKVLKNIGRRIGEIREAKGLRQEDLAAKAGLSARHLQRYEAAEDVHLAVEMLVRIANALEVDYLDLHNKAKTPAPGRGRPKRK